MMADDAGTGNTGRDRKLFSESLEDVEPETTSHWQPTWNERARIGRSLRFGFKSFKTKRGTVSATLMICVFGKIADHVANGWYPVSQDNIRSHCGKSIDAVRKAIAALKAIRILKVKRTRSRESRGQSANHYCIDWAVAREFTCDERQSGLQSTLSIGESTSESVPQSTSESVPQSTSESVPQSTSESVPQSTSHIERPEAPIERAGARVEEREKEREKETDFSFSPSLRRSERLGALDSAILQTLPVEIWFCHESELAALLLTWRKKSECGDLKNEDVEKLIGAILAAREKRAEDHPAFVATCLRRGVKSKWQIRGRRILYQYYRDLNHTKAPAESADIERLSEVDECRIAAAEGRVGLMKDEQLEELADGLIDVDRNLLKHVHKSKWRSGKCRRSLAKILLEREMAEASQ